MLNLKENSSDNLSDKTFGGKPSNVKNAVAVGLVSALGTSAAHGVVISNTTDIPYLPTISDGMIAGSIRFTPGGIKRFMIDVLNGPSGRVESISGVYDTSINTGGLLAPEVYRNHTNWMLFTWNQAPTTTTEADNPSQVFTGLSCSNIEELVGYDANTGHPSYKVTVNTLNLGIDLSTHSAVALIPKITLTDGSSHAQIFSKGGDGSALATDLYFTRSLSGAMTLRTIAETTGNANTAYSAYEINVVPETSTFLAVGAGLVALAYKRIKKSLNHK